MLLAASGSAGRPVWRRHRATAEKALAASWPGDRAGRYPAALLLWLMRNASETDPGGAFALVSSQRDCPEPWARAVAWYVTGFGALGEGDTEAAERAMATAVEGFRALGDRWGTALALDVLAGLAGGRGDRARAIALTDEALALTGELGALEDSADLLVNRGDQLDDPAAARADYASAVGQVHMDSWTRGRTALIGDAAYCPSSLSGMGSGLALVGAYVLAGELAAAHGDHRVAYARYEEEMREYATGCQKMGDGVAKLMVPRNRTLAALLNGYYRLIPYLPGKNMATKIARKTAENITLRDYHVLARR
ncbi:putative monooxygenase [Streptomyces bingchenggensis BCW-1]|uniref:Putative monooxygenase n=1 Tax=Streptomyces bingchenggensis (strain BCW-1) TaxID=749414 RepID=D7CCP2_STRBB|nr:putative monooxygenase [Streptomyces bingchenggensis BCW-1]